MDEGRDGLRERKKRATRQALREAALRLALESGPENVRVDDIAEAAGVSPRTYNNYFASREQAIVAGVLAEREARIAAAVAGGPAGVGLADVVVDAVVAAYTEPDPRRSAAMLLITTRPALRSAFTGSTSAIERPLADAMRSRHGEVDEPTARVLAASVAAAVRVALDQWVRPAFEPPEASAGLVVPAGSLPDLLRAALAPLRPALDAAANPSGRRAGGSRRTRG